MSALPKISTIPKIIEGTWEEILQRAPEFTGHRVRVTVMDQTATQASILTSESTPAERQAWVKSLEEWINSLPPLGPWDDSRDAIYGDIS